MKAAVVRAAGEAPVWEAFEPPRPGAGEEMIEVRASAVSQLARARASGRHYSHSGGFPFVAGVDGVGRTAAGRRVYFAFPRAPWGAMAERVAIGPATVVPVPDALDDITAAALANPGMSSWMALAERAAFQPGETVLINGATGGSGRLAVQIARHFGAGRVVVSGRNPARLAELAALGADRIVSLAAEPGAVAEAFAEECARGVDVVLDYLWGESARAILDAAAHHGDPARALRFVQIGAISGESLALPGAWLRGSAIALMGSGLGSVPMPRMMAAIEALFATAPRIGLNIATTTRLFAAVAEAWRAETGDKRLVLTAP